MTFTCTVCGSPEWMAVAPGTAPDASRFLGNRVSEIRPSEWVEAKSYCLSHWPQSWVPIPNDRIEDENEAIGQSDIFEFDRIATAHAAVSAPEPTP